MFLVIDNYDSFTYNLVHFLGELGADLVVKRNDMMSVADVLSGGYEGVILSPGPCTPSEAGIMLDLIKQADGHLPIFGVCLGMQAIGEAYGGDVVRASRLMHGKVSEVTHHGRDCFEGLPSPFNATRYHSLCVAPESLPNTLEITASTGDGTIMGLAHQDHPVHGVQFHPESIASEHGHAMLRNVISQARKFNANRRPDIGRKTA